LNFSQGVVVKSKALIFVMLFAGTIMLAQSNPIPLVYQPLVPTSIAPGSNGFTLTVNGSGFVSGAVVKWNGAPLSTSFVSSSRLTASVPQANIATAGTARVTVVNPGMNTYPQVTYFPVRQPSSNVSFSLDKGVPLAVGPVSAGDFNNDGKLDFVVGEQEGGSNRCVCVATVLGNGKGGFQSPLFSFVNAGQYYMAPIASADLDNDGILDLLVADPGEAVSSVLLGNGDGSFSYILGYSFPFVDNTGAMVFADFNADGNLDVFNCGVDSASGEPVWGVFLGLGNGEFRNGEILEPGNCSAVPAIGDFNGDGKLDFAVMGSTGKNPTVAIYFGNGDGTFNGPASYPIQKTAHNLVAADMNGDGILDIVTDGVDVLLGNGKGSFTDIGGPNLVQRVGTGLYLALGDFNGDGKLDLIVDNLGGPQGSTQTVNLLLGKGNGTFASGFSFPAGYSEGYSEGSFAIGDFNNDGKLDVALSASTSLPNDASDQAYVALQK
jgi:hypothetical protein